MRGGMRLALLLCVLAVHASFALGGFPQNSGMTLRSRDSSAASSADDNLEVEHINPDSNVMKAAGVPDEDMQNEDGQAMATFSEDSLDVGGHGEAMQLSGPILPTVTTSDRKIEVEDEEPRVSDDMVQGAQAIGSVLDAKQAQLADYRHTIEQAKDTLEEQTKAAKRLIQDAYSKQAYLRDLQKQILEQTAALDAQKRALAEREAEIGSLKSQLDLQTVTMNAQNNIQTSQSDVSAAIQAQMEVLQKKQKELETTSSSKESELKEMHSRLEQLKAVVEERDQAAAQKEEEVKKMMSEIEKMNKASEEHEAKIREEEAAMKKQRDELDAKENHIAENLKQLNKKLAQIRREEVESQNALQTEATVEYSISEMPPSAKRELAVHDNELTPVVQFRQQPQIEVQRQVELILPSPEPKQTIQIVDTSSRSVETRLDERPSTYGQKELVGQTYSARYVPNDVFGHADPDGKCRNSRGDEVDCNQYDTLPPGKVPPVIPSIGDLLDSASEYPPPSGPCMLKCGYHYGRERSIQYVSIEIPTNKGVFNQTIACPKANNGYPFISCNLLSDESSQCRSTCIFDGSANPLKPRMIGIDGKSLSAADFKSLAYTTYKTVTTNGCASRMSADPLVACEVRL